MEAETVSTTEESLPSEDDKIDDDFLCPEECLAKSCLSTKTKKTSHTSSLLDRIHAPVEAFFGQNLDPKEVLRKQYEQMGKDCSTVN